MEEESFEDFWALIEDSRRRAACRDEREELLRDRLVKRPPREIVRFQIQLHRVRQRVDTWEMWAAAEQIFGGSCSDDSFWYFQFWLVGLGREDFRTVVADPDALADIAGLRRLAGRPLSAWPDDEWPEWEGLDYVAAGAYEELTGEENGLEEALEAEGVEHPCNPEPDGEAWGVRHTEEAARRLPRLSTMFPLPEPAAGRYRAG
ncbi:DUF4240 domain-containing protein [Streptomyces sp. NPDC079020]|uniref:DUF4240 domain-containing protein n=1 Tax=Streptomyces sp. NPDC079020 TaxID=3365722 RepID=UPI0037CDB85D